MISQGPKFYKYAGNQVRKLLRGNRENNSVVFLSSHYVFLFLLDLSYKSFMWESAMSSDSDENENEANIKRSKGRPKTEESEDRAGSGKVGIE